MNVHRFPPFPEHVSQYSKNIFTFLHMKNISRSDACILVRVIESNWYYLTKINLLIFNQQSIELTENINHSFKF